MVKTKSEFERRLRRITKQLKLNKLDCYCQNWDGIELRDDLLTQFHKVIIDANHDFPQLRNLRSILQRLDSASEKNFETITHEREIIQQTITAIQKWLKTD